MKPAAPVTSHATGFGLRPLFESFVSFHCLVGTMFPRCSGLRRGEYAVPGMVCRGKGRDVFSTHDILRHPVGPIGRIVVGDQDFEFVEERLGAKGSEAAFQPARAVVVQDNDADERSVWRSARLFHGVQDRAGRTHDRKPAVFQHQTLAEGREEHGSQGFTCDMKT